MREIKKHGSIDLYEGTCKICGCIFTFSDIDTKHIINYKMNTEGTISCPKCDNEMWWSDCKLVNGGI